MDILTSVLVQPYTGDREFTAGEISDLVFADEDGDHVGLALLGTASNELGENFDFCSYMIRTELQNMCIAERNIFMGPSFVDFYIDA